MTNSGNLSSIKTKLVKAKKALNKMAMAFIEPNENGSYTMRVNEYSRVGNKYSVFTFDSLQEAESYALKIDGIHRIFIE